MGYGIAYFHSKNPSIVHGDLHPRNVMVSTDGQAKIIDFGTSGEHDTSFTLGQHPILLRLENDVDRYKDIIQQLVSCSGIRNEALTSFLQFIQYDTTMKDCLQHPFFQTD